MNIDRSASSRVLWAAWLGRNSTGSARGDILAPTADGLEASSAWRIARAKALLASGALDDPAVLDRALDHLIAGAQ